MTRILGLLRSADRFEWAMLAGVGAWFVLLLAVWAMLSRTH